jgi:hypothetical protein
LVAHVGKNRSQFISPLSVSLRPVRILIHLVPLHSLSQIDPMRKEHKDRMGPLT